MSQYEIAALIKKVKFDDNNLYEKSEQDVKSKYQEKFDSSIFIDKKHEYSSAFIDNFNESKFLFNLTYINDNQSNNNQGIRIYNRKKRDINNHIKNFSSFKLNQKSFVENLNCQIDPFSNLSFVERQIKYKNSLNVYLISKIINNDFKEITENPKFLIDSDTIINQPHLVEQLQTIRKIIKTKTRISGFNGCEYESIFIHAGGILAIKENDDFSVFSLKTKNVSNDFNSFNNINYARCLYTYKNQIVNFNFYKCCDSQTAKFSISEVFNGLINPSLINLEFDECRLSNLTSPIVETIKNTLKKYTED
ncbi:hypothetical protein GVAV_000113 [Gurleya vavrai]